MKKDEIYIPVRYADGKANLLRPGDNRFLQEYCLRREGKMGYLIFATGKISKSYRQLCFFHGPLIDAFINLTGDADRLRWKRYLKENYLDRDAPEEIPSLAKISMRRMAKLLQRCVDHLIDQGGRLGEYETREYKEVTA